MSYNYQDTLGLKVILYNWHKSDKIVYLKVYFSDIIVNLAVTFLLIINIYEKISFKRIIP